jgi:AcrR family transcriptional regulator
MPAVKAATTSKQKRKVSEAQVAPVTSLRAAQKALLLQRVHDAARELFYRYGYHDTTIDQIATAAGIQRATLYKHFRNKQDILEMMAERYGDGMVAVTSTLPGPVPSRAEIDAWMQRIAAFIKKERTPTVLINGLAMSDEPEAITHIGVRIIQRLAENVTAYRCALEPGPRQQRAYAIALLIARDICWNSLRLARNRKDPLAQHAFELTGDMAEAFFREYS